jgi:alkylation response protein AidB-like acyl-CoA dehydrogenase
MPRGDQDLVPIEQLAGRFAEKELAPLALQVDRYPFVPWNDRPWRAACELDLVGMALPESVGGTDQGMLAFAHALETIAATDAGQAVLLFSQALARATLVALAPDGIGVGLATLRGNADALLGYALYDDPEESASEVIARVSGDGLVLNGTLAEVACLPVARHVLVAARLEDKDGPRVYCVVDVSAPGCRVSEPVLTLGLHACPCADLTLTDVCIASSARLGEADAEQRYATAAERFRPALVAIALGLARGSFTLAFDYARQRRQAKKIIVHHHMVQEMLSDLLCTYELGMLALHTACDQVDRGRANHTTLLAFQETILTMVTRRTTDGVQLLGGNGYMHDYGQEKRMRDAKQLQAVFGSSAQRRLRVIERRLRSEE